MDATATINKPARSKVGAVLGSLEENLHALSKSPSKSRGQLSELQHQLTDFCRQIFPALDFTGGPTGGKLFPGADPGFWSRGQDPVGMQEGMVKLLGLQGTCPTCCLTAGSFHETTCLQQFSPLGCEFVCKIHPDPCKCRFQTWTSKIFGPVKWNRSSVPFPDLNLRGATLTFSMSSALRPLLPPAASTSQQSGRDPGPPLQQSVQSGGSGSQIYGRTRKESEVANLKLDLSWSAIGHG